MEREEHRADFFHPRSHGAPCGPRASLGLLVWVGAGLGGLSACDPGPGDAPDPRGPAAEAPAVDHHLHVWSDDAVEALLEIQDVVGQTLVAEGDGALTGERVVAALDSAGIERGVVHSVAYFFGFPEVNFSDEEARVRRENDWVAEQVAAHRDRLVGFCGMNPLAPYALREVERCAGLGGIVGIKLHLANSDVNLRNPEHLERLGAVFEWADEVGLALAVHLRTRRPEYGGEDVTAFFAGVLSRAPTVPVQVAHLGGWGGFDEPTALAIQTFNVLLRDPDTDPAGRLFFDMAAAPIPRERAGDDPQLQGQVETVNRQVAEAIRILGVDRVLFGSDYPARSVAEAATNLRDELGLDPDEIRAIFSNRAPYLP
jgi:predicted TIM-barrel fold metal-dependent hydrolase